jgi:hypothetical protein
MQQLQTAGAVHEASRALWEKTKIYYGKLGAFGAEVPEEVTTKLRFKCRKTSRMIGPVQKQFDERCGTCE